MGKAGGLGRRPGLGLFGKMAEACYFAPSEVTCEVVDGSNITVGCESGEVNPQGVDGDMLAAAPARTLCRRRSAAPLSMAAACKPHQLAHQHEHRQHELFLSARHPELVLGGPEV